MTKERILQFIEYKGITLTDFFKITGIKRGFLDTDKLKSSVSDVFLTKILASFPEINPEWLITGKGDMMRNNENEQEDFNIAIDNTIKFKNPNEKENNLLLLNYLSEKYKEDPEKYKEFAKDILEYDEIVSEVITFKRALQKIFDKLDFSGGILYYKQLKKENMTFVEQVNKLSSDIKEEFERSGVIMGMEF